jgi:hypothetical protein
MKNLIMISALCLLTSCMSFSDKPLRPVRNSIDQQLPEISLEKEMGISIGGGIFNFLDIITFNEADLSEIDSVQVGVYQIHPRGGNVEFTDAVFEKALLAKDASLTWDRIVRVRDGGEQVWVFVGMDLERNSLEAVSVFVLEQDELVLINVDGDLSEMLEYAMEPARGHRGVYKAG